MNEKETERWWVWSKGLVVERYLLGVRGLIAQQVLDPSLQLFCGDGAAVVRVNLLEGVLQAQHDALG